MHARHRTCVASAKGDAAPRMPATSVSRLARDSQSHQAQATRATTQQEEEIWRATCRTAFACLQRALVAAAGRSTLAELWRGLGSAGLRAS